MSINATLFGQMITFLLFVWFTKKFVWPPLVNALKERQTKIADGLAAAERGHVELCEAQAEIALLRKQAKEEAANITLDAQKQADAIVENARHQAREEGQRLILQARAEVEHMVNVARESLRKQVAGIALLGAEKILGHNIDLKAHNDMLDKLQMEI